MSEAIQALSALQILSRNIHELEVRAEERLKAQHGRFNVFTTLLSAHDEVRLHTRFLHELLNPEGTHDCGDLFLKLFFETLQKHKALEHDDSVSEEEWGHYDQSCLWIGKEVSTNQGQLDLLLEFDSHLLVIENKIWAGEQDRQLARYIDYLESQNKQSRALYLTLDGRAATTHENKAYLRISYKEHIMAWLERCLHSTYNIVPINQVLIQYRNVVKQLIGQTMEIETMQMIKEFIRQNPLILKTHSEVAAAVEEIRKERRQEMKQRFADDLIESLSDAYIVTLRPHMTESSFAIDDNPGLVIQSKEDDFTANHPFSVWVEHNRWGALCIGIEAKWGQPRELKPEEESLLALMKSRISDECTKLGMNFYGLSKTWWGTYWPTGVHDIIKPFLDDDTVEQIKENPQLEKELVNTADAEVRVYMKLLEAAYNASTHVLKD
jgi:hypothetical protein